MKVLKCFDADDEFSNSVIALGFFDGVHLAHQSVIKSAVNLAKFLKIPSVTFTFKQHPNAVLKGRAFPYLLATFEEKVSFIEKLDVDFLCWEDFNEKFFKISARDFVLKTIVKKMKAKILVAGYNYRFGHQAFGDEKFLEKMGEEFAFKVKVIRPQRYKEKIISSSLIRDLLQKGKVKLASEYLGRDYFVTGKIRRGNERGKLIGVKTANLNWPEEKVKVLEGVYATFVKLGDRFYKGVASYGRSPTFDDEGKKLEVHLFDYEENIYRKEITVYFAEKIRKIKKFHNFDELAGQIQKDIRLARKILKNREIPKV